MFDEVLDDERTLDSFIAKAPQAPPITDNRPVNEYFLLRSVK
jgi:hypothetical protein